MNEAISKATADHELRMRQLQDSVDALERQVTWRQPNPTYNNS